MMQEKRLGLGGINLLPGRMQTLRPELVKQLMKSIRERGLDRAITVRRRDGGGGYWLVDGLHRLMACKKLKHTAIRAVIVEDRVLE